MNRYDKISSGNGIHGVKYEINLLSYYLLKAYESKENFQLSNGQKDKLKLDDIILETDNSRIFVQAKHVENTSKKITINQLFEVTGKYSLHVYLKVAWDIFQQFLQDIQGRLQELLSFQRDQQEAEQLNKTVGAISKIIVNLIDNFSEETYQNLVSNLQKLNNERINALLRSFQNTKFHLVTNISPNEELQAFSIVSSSHYESTKYYNFNNENTFNKLIEKSDISKRFIKTFLENFHLVTVSNDSLCEYVNNYLKLLSSNLEIPHEISFDDIYGLIEDWQAKKAGVYLTRHEMNAFFAYKISTKFIDELKTYEGLVEFNFDDLQENISNFLVTIIETPRYLLIMANLQKIFLKKELTQILFVNPLSDLTKQRLVIKSFLHQKFTHLVCVVQQNTKELIPLFDDLILNIEKNEKFKSYKKIIILCNEGAETFNYGNRVVVQDSLWFKDCKLYIKREPNSLGDMDSYYIPRQISKDSGKHKKLTRTEEDFINRKIDHNSLAIISDSAGMGKTSLLKSFVAKINKENQHWAIMIQLNLFTDLLEKHSLLKTVPNLEDILNKLVTDTFERQVCQIPNILIIMIDGFDEISPDYSDIVIKFLKNIKREKNVKTVFVTTRRHFGKLLKKSFYRASYSLEPLPSEDICSLISIFRKQDLNDTKQWYDSLPRKISDFFVNPLHVKMFSSSFQINEQLPNDLETFNLYKLYDDFVNEKKDIFINDKCLCQGNIYVKKMLNENFDHLIDIYEKFALEMTFKKAVLQELGIEENNENAFNEDLCTNGILEYSEARLGFVHDTFREFFVAKWVIAQINSKDEYKIKAIMEKIFMKPYEIKRFIESYLVNNWDKLTEDILKIFGNVTSQYSESFFDMLYLNYDFIFLTKLMTEKCKNTLLLTKLLEDFLNIFSSDRHIVRLDFFFYLIQRGANANCKTERGANFLQIAVERNNTEIVRLLFETGCFNVNEEDVKGVTVLILALMKNNIEMAEYFINHGADINQLKKQIDITYNRRNRVVSIEYRPNNTYRNCRFIRQDIISVKANSLHIAAYNGNVNSIKYILSKNVCEIDDLTSQNCNLLHCTAQGGNLDAAKYFCSLNVRLDQVSDRGETVLHFAVCSGNLDLVEYFVKSGVKIDAVTSKNYTALYLAVFHKKYEIIKFLLQSYLTLEIADSSSVYRALLFLCGTRDYNDIFKTVYEKYEYFFLENALIDLLKEAVNSNNVDLVQFLLLRNINETQMHTASNACPT